MGASIETTGYALGLSFPLSLPQTKKKEDKNTRKSGTFRTIFKAILSDNRQKSAEINILDQINYVSQEEAMVILQDAVRSAGDALKERRTFENILLYKQAVKNFIGYVTREAYTVTTKVAVGRDKHDMLTRKTFTHVIIINEKLDRFAADLLSDQRGQLYILERLEEIYGLLVDLIT
ncbi:MAG: DUF327 family protein [Treponema sp.]